MVHLWRGSFVIKYWLYLGRSRTLGVRIKQQRPHSVTSWKQQRLQSVISDEIRTSFCLLNANIHNTNILRFKQKYLSMIDKYSLKGDVQLCFLSKATGTSSSIIVATEIITLRLYWTFRECHTFCTKYHIIPLNRHNSLNWTSLTPLYRTEKWGSWKLSDFHIKLSVIPNPYFWLPH